MEKMIQRIAEYHVYHNMYGQSQTMLVCYLFVYLFGRVPDVPPLEFYSFGCYRYRLLSLDWDRACGLRWWGGERQNSRAIRVVVDVLLTYCHLETTLQVREDKNEGQEYLLIYHI